MSLLVAIGIGAGGAAGALARALTGRWIRSDFPLATLLVNVVGSFLLGLFFSGLTPEAEWLRAVLGAGFCGALTTFSTFILEAVLLLRAGYHKRALAYIVLTLLLCCLASWAGMHLMT